MSFVNLDRLFENLAVATHKRQRTDGDSDSDSDSEQTKFFSCITEPDNDIEIVDGSSSPSSVSSTETVINGYSLDTIKKVLLGETFQWTENEWDPLVVNIDSPPDKPGKSIVFRGSISSNLSNVVIKVPPWNEKANQNWKDRFAKEIDYYTDINNYLQKNPNIKRFAPRLLGHNNLNGEFPMLILDKASFNFSIRKSSPRLKLALAKTLLHAVEQFHKSTQSIHCDIRHSHFIISQRHYFKNSFIDFGDSYFVGDEVWIIDFGNSHKKREKVDPNSVYAPAFRHPELCRSNENVEIQPKHDYYALWMTCLALFMGWNEYCTHQTVLKSVDNFNPREELPPLLTNMIKSFKDQLCSKETCEDILQFMRSLESECNLE